MTAQLPKSAAPSRTPSVSDGVTEQLVSAILDGTYGPGVRLPPERELTELTGASRISVRRALARLESWRMIEISHGSGTVVLPRRRWAFGVLPQFVQRAKSFDELRPVLLETLSLRHHLLTELLCREGSYLSPGDLDPAREQMRLAWASRPDVARFLDHDLEKSRLVLEKRGLTATLWLLNSVADAIVELAQSVPAELAFPEGYVEEHLKFFDALEANDLKKAHAIIGRLFKQQDQAILSVVSLLD